MLEIQGLMSLISFGCAHCLHVEAKQHAHNWDTENVSLGEKGDWDE